MSIPITNSPPAVPRRVVLFGIMLSLSLAILGIAGSYLVASLNGDYQEIVNRQLPSLAVVRDVSQVNANGRRFIEVLPLRLSPEELSSLRSRVTAIRDENTLRLARLEGLLDSEEGQRLISELLASRRVYHAEVDKFFNELSQGMSQARRDHWRVKISEIDAHYVIVQDRLAEYCGRSASARGEDLTRRSRRLTLFFLVTAAWPLILAVGFFFFGLASTLLLFYRARR